MHHPLQCRCGQLAGYVAHARPRGRILCYCRDCQAFAHFLGDPQTILDKNAGSDVIPASVADVHFTKGLKYLACMRLSPTGLYRWYASCCRTPIGSTPANPRIAYIGLLHSCLRSGASLDETFGPVRVWAFTHNAHGPMKKRLLAMATSVPRIIGMIASESLRRQHRFSPFLQPDYKTPIVTPRVLTLAERTELIARVEKSRRVNASH